MFAIIDLTDHDDHLLHALNLQHHILNLTEFDTQATEFDLMVSTSKDNHIAIG